MKIIKSNIKGENYYKVTRENGNNEYYTLDKFSEGFADRK